MPRPSRWSDPTIKDGIWTYTLVSWKYFHDLVTQEFLRTPNFVWRGQRVAEWPLQSSFDRSVPLADSRKRGQAASRHLARFKLASRGRRGFAPQKIEKDNEWWAIAQHNGMVTPLLDWTESPFVALYFAFEKVTKRGERAVYGLGNLAGKLRELERGEISRAFPSLELIRPLQDDNARLVSQAGLFTRLPLGLTVEAWVGMNFMADTSVPRLVKVVIPDDGREECLLTLNRMNINHLSLFPDLYGAGEHCNKALKLPNYAASSRL